MPDQCDHTINAQFIETEGTLEKGTGERLRKVENRNRTKGVKERGHVVGIGTEQGRTVFHLLPLRVSGRRTRGGTVRITVFPEA